MDCQEKYEKVMHIYKKQDFTRCGFISSGETKCQQILYIILEIHNTVVLSFERLRNGDR